VLSAIPFAVSDRPFPSGSTFAHTISLDGSRERRQHMPTKLPSHYRKELKMWKLTLSSLAVGLLLAGPGVAPVTAGDAIPAGQKIYTTFKCTQCHSIDSLKIAKVKSEEKEEETLAEGEKKVDPPDLSGTGNNHDAVFMAKWLMKEEKIEGKKHKKKFKGNEEELKILSEWLVTLKFNVPKKKG
jgi:mono/diheme cytochrome c family protein